MPTTVGAIDKAVVSSFLKSRQETAGRSIRYTIALSFAAGLLVIAQAWIVALIVMDTVFNGTGLDTQWPRLGLLVVVVVCRFACSAASEALAARAAANVHCALRRDLLDHVRSVGPVGLTDKATGATVAAMTDSLRVIEPYFSRYIPAATIATLLPVALLIAVIPHDWLSALVFVVTAPLIPLFMVLIGAGAERMNQRQWRKLARLSGHLLDSIQGLTTLKVFAASRREAANVARLAEDYRRETMAILRLAFLSSMVLEFFATISIALIAVFIGFRLLWGEMVFFNGFFVLLLAPEFYLPLRTLGGAYHARMEAIGAGERVVEVFKMLPVGASKDMAGEPAAVIDQPMVRLDNVAVVFPDGRKGIDGLDLEIRPGETLAVVGPSGGGKSMVFNLLLGFVAPTSGLLTVDGRAFEEIDREAWRQRIAYLPQRPHMFNASVRANIAMRFDGGDIDETRLRFAAKRAHIDHVIEQLPEGYGTRLGEQGYGLSGGEIQRLAIARAFYRDAPILMIDEATAHLDRESERLVMVAIGDLKKGRTTVMIAHRLSTIETADRVAEIADGRVAGIFTPKEYLERASRFNEPVRPGEGA